MWLEHLAASLDIDAATLRERFAAFLSTPFLWTAPALTEDDQLRDVLGVPRAV